MSVLSKLQIIEENVPKVYEAGKLQSGGNPLEYAKQLTNLFYDATFPENHEVTITAPFVTAMNSCFQNASNVKTITMIGNNNGSAVSCSGSFRGCSVEVIDLTGFIAKISNGQLMFSGAKFLKTIKGELDLSECTNTTNAFASCTALEQVQFKDETISLSISFANSTLLTAESVQSIIDGLATVETAQTLTLHRAITLTDEQKAQISSKNWTLVQ